VWGGGRGLNTLRALALLVVWTWLAPGSGLGADPPGSEVSRAALELCNQAQAMSGTDADAALEESLALADRAIAADESDALAHFARFCALGQQARRSGASLSSLVKLWAIRDAVDRTLELVPDFPAALLGKGALLCSLPRLLGGDPSAGEQLVQRALQIEPDYVGARLFLAEKLEERGERAAARDEAERGLAAAERKNDSEGASDARRILNRLDSRIRQRPQRESEPNSSARRA